MDNITVIVDEYPQEITVEVTTTGITVDQANDIVTNNAKVGITPQQALDINTNNNKVGITPQQSADIVTNNAKVSDINHVDIQLSNVDNTSDLNKPISTATAQLVNTEQASRISSDNVLQGNIDTEEAARINSDNNLQSQITANESNIAQEITDRTSADSTLQSNINNLDVRVTANDLKVGITTQQSDDIVTNNSKVGITTQQAVDITANNVKVSDINHVTLELPNVDNTSDLDKPISNATQSALDLKTDKTQNQVNTENIFKSVSFAMDYSDRVLNDSGTIESRDCVMNGYLNILK